jgi:hypothetical protein
VNNVRVYYCIQGDNEPDGMKNATHNTFSKKPDIWISVASFFRKCNVGCILNSVGLIYHPWIIILYYNAIFITIILFTLFVENFKQSLTRTFTKKNVYKSCSFARRLRYFCDRWNCQPSVSGKKIFPSFQTFGGHCISSDLIEQCKNYNTRFTTDHIWVKTN